jgi:hypothetical protein
MTINVIQHDNRLWYLRPECIARDYQFPFERSFLFKDIFLFGKRIKAPKKQRMLIYIRKFLFSS